MTHTTAGVSTGNVGGVGGVGPVPGVGGVGGVGGAANNMGAVNQLGGAAPSSAPPAAAAPSTQGADMKRAYEALGITCPTSVANMGGFPRAPLSRMAVPRAPGLAEPGPPQPMPALFAQQPADLQQQQQQQLVSARLASSHSVPYGLYLTIVLYLCRWGVHCNYRAVP